MKFNKFYVKIFIIFIFIFFMFPTFSFCASPSVDFDYTYNYKITNSSSLEDILNEAINSDYVYSGEYYYFVCNARHYNYNISYPQVFYIKKSSLTSYTFKPEFIYCDGYYTFNLSLTCSNTSDFINTGTYTKVNNDVITFSPLGVWDDNVRTFTIPFYTNFDSDFIITYSNNTTNVLIHSTPYIADDDHTIANLNGSYFLINPGNSDITEFHFAVCQTVREDLGDGMFYDKEVVLKDISVDTSPPYYNCPLGDDYWWEIPYSAFEGLNIKAGETYNWRIRFNDGSKNVYVDRKIKSNVDYTFSGSTNVGDDDGKDDFIQNAIDNSTSAIIDSNKETQNAIQNQTEAIQENTETNKGIWDTLKEVLSYLNPFSENFFVYKLIDLLIDGLKTLFIPSDDFFSTYFEDLRDWFSDRLGFLWTPFDIIIEILEDISSINFSEPVISCPDIYEPFTNTKIISSFSFNFNSLLDNNTFKTVHNIYLICVDAIIIFAMIHLTHKKIEEVFSN